MTMLVLSLVANVLVTFAVTLVIWQNRFSVDNVYGPDMPARRILACVYLAIGAVSLYALLQLGAGQENITRGVALTLLPLQIVYKLMTAVALPVMHPVVLANLGIAALHAVTLLTL
ncbi:hypothetical protein AB2B41_01720 [Marimonas sp. MJW-29]|uniref:Uncharacterized protein n=1 Tax=Sulfitobacter sediminis TaxID=3234186 RepID=A0ABV3RH63_9RHOB